ncbi:hypothetical protein J2T09_000864 [Neorhizobium huautlense]|uniref:Uncharacterized protein n=1 Tax=Neorhizobium huautlense TaxID=67774 RepID=A0ABT9PNV4_9HYPH|nr:hypothetical protein [Neorhizobium huautlense]MDP9836122.1 hypothetical protein [Neorhizobium huautlense]
MRKSKDIKEDLLLSLASKADSGFLAKGFNRASRSLDYKRKLSESSHSLSLSVSFNPRYDNGKEVAFHPWIRVTMPAVGKVLAGLIDKQTHLIAGSADMVLVQPVHFGAPKPEYRRWSATGVSEMENALSDIASFFEQWGEPLLGQLQNAANLLEMYEAKNTHFMITHDTYLRAAAAAIAVGKPDKAMQILDENLGKPGLRKKYQTIFDAVASLNTTPIP